MSFPSSPILPSASDALFKQFFLETERLEGTYHHLQERFHALQVHIQETRTRFAGKLAELDFTSRYLETLLQQIAQGILFIDLKGFVTTYNGAAENVLQLPKERLLFHPFLDFFPDHFFGFSLKEALAVQQGLSQKLISWKRNDQTLELEVEANFVEMSPQAYPLDHHHPAPPIQGLLISFRDVTKLHRLQERVYRHDRLKELGELAAHLAHEIRNPLGGIRGFATLLQQELATSPDLQAMAASIVQGTDELTRFVSQILSYTHPFEPHFEKIELVFFLEEIRQLIQADSCWQPTIDFTIQSASSPFFASIDPHLFKSALLNLFVNAGQAMPNGGALHVKLETEPSWLVLSIQDTGKGILPEHFPHLFSPFFTTKETGNGLGLAEVHKVIQAHRGWIDVQSVLGQGTVFTIRIPMT